MRIIKPIIAETKIILGIVSGDVVIPETKTGKRIIVTERRIFVRKSKKEPALIPDSYSLCKTIRQRGTDWWNN